MLGLKVNMHRESYQFNIAAYFVVEYKVDGSIYDKENKICYLIYYNDSRYDLYEAGDRFNFDGEKVFEEVFIFSDVNLGKCENFVKSYHRKKKIENILNG